MADTTTSRLKALFASGKVSSFLFLRHSETATKDSSLPLLEADLARVLTEAGITKCKRASEQLFGGWLASRGVSSEVKLCLVSPTIRTRDTARHVLGKSVVMRDIERFYNPEANREGTVMHVATAKLGYAPLQAYLDEGEATRLVYARFGEQALAEVVAVVESESSDALGCVVCCGHAIDSSAVALAACAALSGSSSCDGSTTIRGVNQGTCGAMLIDQAGAGGTVRAAYFECAE